MRWGIIKVTPNASDIVRAWVSPVRQRAGQYVNFYAETSGPITSVKAYIPIVDPATGKSPTVVKLTDPDGDKTWQAQWQIPAGQATGNISFTMKAFNSGVQVGAWPVIKVQ